MPGSTTVHRSAQDNQSPAAQLCHGRRWCLCPICQPSAWEARQIPFFLCFVLQLFPCASVFHRRSRFRRWKGAEKQQAASALQSYKPQTPTLARKGSLQLSHRHFQATPSSAPACRPPDVWLGHTQQPDLLAHPCHTGTEPPSPAPQPPGHG